MNVDLTSIGIRKRWPVLSIVQRFGMLASGLGWASVPVMEGRNLIKLHLFVTLSPLREYFIVHGCGR